VEHDKKTQPKTEQAIDTFNNGLCRTDFIEEMGRARPKTVGEPMDPANKPFISVKSSVNASSWALKS
jgi:hypothetical protein